MTPLGESAIVLCAILCSTLAGAVIRKAMPEHHTADPTRAHSVTSVAIVSTIAALVLSLAVSNANLTRTATRQDVTAISSSIVRVDGLLRRYGREADQARATLRRYAISKLEDLFPEQPGAPATLSNAASTATLEQMQDDLAGLQPGNDVQRWQRSQALELSNQIMHATWAIAERDAAEVPPVGVWILGFWLAILFGTYGLFMPRNATAVAISALSAFAVAGAMLLILDARNPFDGVTHISSRPLAAAASAVQR